MGMFTVCQQECVSSALTDFPSLAPQVSRNLRALFAGHSTSLIESCAMGADREVLLVLLLLLWPLIPPLLTFPFHADARRADGVEFRRLGTPERRRRRRCGARWRGAGAQECPQRCHGSQVHGHAVALSGWELRGRFGMLQRMFYRGWRKWCNMMPKGDEGVEHLVEHRGDTVNDLLNLSLVWCMLVYVIIVTNYYHGWSSQRTLWWHDCCQESANLKRTALERLWEEYHFGPLVEEAYPCDACGLQGLSMFLEFHIGRNGESRSNLLGSQHFLLDFCFLNFKRV